MCENSIVGSDSESSSRGESNDHIGNTKRYESFLSIRKNNLVMWTITINKGQTKTQLSSMRYHFYGRKIALNS